MQQDKHPDYQPVVFRDRAAGYAFLTRSTATSSGRSTSPTIPLTAATATTLHADDAVKSGSSASATSNVSDETSHAESRRPTSASVMRRARLGGDERSSWGMAPPAGEGAAPSNRLIITSPLTVGVTPDG